MKVSRGRNDDEIELISVTELRKVVVKVAVKVGSCRQNRIADSLNYYLGR